MTVPTDLTAETESLCWCCGQTYPDDQVVHLGSRPEVAVCFRCARFLSQRAQSARARESGSPIARVRGVLDHGRDFAVGHGLHRLPVLGSALRWIGDRMP